MPLTQPVIDAIELLMNGDPTDGDSIYIERVLNEIASARDDVKALIRIHADISDANCLTVLVNAKSRMTTAAQALDDLLNPTP